MDFCPSCANILQEEIGPMNILRLYCQTCPYVFPVLQKRSREQLFTRKPIDEILLDAIKLQDGWDPSVEKIKCPDCGCPKILFKKVLTRSQYDAQDSFYKCLEPSCNLIWKCELQS
eukprot:TRINITY_DN13610_c0_g1_i1.p3 TRINITY_DN13610_c0_g1~~TRINITY_DN13610_c0_g1_i1.p3  ORF type:complete len:116 (-),score=39.24 TRINITY_DN13610_c0_g1_i1:77-424(-)